MSIGKFQTGPRVQAAVVSYRTQIYILGKDHFLMPNVKIYLCHQKNYGMTF